MPQSERERLESLRTQLSNERATFRTHWRDLSDYILPRRSRFVTSDSNKGDRRNLKIIDSTATLAARTLRSGMMGGITSPARPWFRLTMADPVLADIPVVREWLHEVTLRMQTMFIRSNLYRTLPIVYGDLGTFGTAAMMVEEDLDTGIWTYAFPIGSYMMANDRKGRVRVFFREFRMTVRQIAEEFGEGEDAEGNLLGDNISDQVKNLYKESQLEAWIEVCHCIYPNPKYDPEKLASKFKRFRSVTYEKGSSQFSNSNYIDPKRDIFLRDKGYDMFPVLGIRWEVATEDVYGTSCPGMDALGDVKQLQIGEKRSAQAVEKMVNPPMVAPTALKTVRTSLLPGDVTYSDEREGQKGFRPAHTIDPKVAELEEKQSQVRQRVRRAFYEDLFLMLATDTRRQPPTAREIDERHEEKLLALGPMLEQLNQDGLDPLIDIGFFYLARQGAIPPPPEEIQGQPLKVEYISIMAQAQKLVGIGGLERFLGFLTNTAQAFPQVLDKADPDEIVDEYADAVGIPPKLINTTEEAIEIRAQRAQAQQQAQMMEGIEKASGAARDLAGASLEEDSALKRLLGQSQAGQVITGA